MYVCHLDTVCPCWILFAFYAIHLTNLSCVFPLSDLHLVLALLTPKPCPRNWFLLHISRTNVAFEIYAVYDYILLFDAFLLIYLQEDVALSFQTSLIFFSSLRVTNLKLNLTRLCQIGLANLMEY